MDVTISRPDLKSFTNPNPTQAQSPSHRFTSKSEQNTTTNHCRWNPRAKRRPRVARGAMHSGKSGAVNSGEMQCILVKSDEFENLHSLLWSSIYSS